MVMYVKKNYSLQFSCLSNIFAKFKNDLNLDDLGTAYCTEIPVQTQHVDWIPSQNKIGEGIIKDS